MIRAVVVGTLVLATVATPPPQPAGVSGGSAAATLASDAFGVEPPARGEGVLLLPLPSREGAGGRGPPSAPFTVTGDAIESPLTTHPADPARGAAIVRNRETANCLICHSIPDPTERFMGEVGPPLAGVGARLTPGQIRLRLVDPTILNPRAVMPAYHRTEGLTNVDPRYAGRPVLDAGEIEDVVAYLTTLKE